MNSDLNKMLEPVINNSIEYLKESMAIPAEVSGDKTLLKKMDSIKNSSLISTIGSVEVDIAIGFEDTLFEKLVEKSLSNEEVDEDKLIDIKKSIVCEILNIIAGKAIKNYDESTTLNMTTPLFTDNMSSVLNNVHKESQTACISTEFGNMLIVITCPIEKISSSYDKDILRVLIVDDSLIVRKNMDKFITSLNQRVVGKAKDGREAVSMCLSLKPDLITMDITMPDMDGITAVKRIMAFDQNVKIIMSTSHGQEKMVLDSIRAGAKGYILKPLTLEKLSEAIVKVFPNIKI